MVEVIVRDPDGRVVKRVAVNEDLFWEYVKRVRASPDRGTRWGVRLLEAIFAPAGTGGTTTFTATDTTGTSRTQNIKFPYTYAPDRAYTFFHTYYCPNRLWIGYGTDPTPPSPSDYKLGNKVAEGLAVATGDDLQGTLTISASFTMTQDTVIYEIGLEWEGTVASYNVCGRFLIDRTVFPEGLTVRAGQTLTVIYRFVL
jgi:hypothetical protein